MKDLVTAQQAARILEVSDSTIRFYKWRGFLTPVPTIDNRIYFRRTDVESYKKTRKTQMKEREKAKKKVAKTTSLDDL